MIKNFAIRWIILLLAPLCSACGSSPSQAQSLGTYTAQVNQFVSAAAAHGKSVDISNLVVQAATDSTSKSSSTTTGGTTTTATDTEVGDCEFTAAGPTVTISSYAAQNYGPETLEALIYHELGHCLLMLQHNSASNPDGSPVSLMNPDGVDGFTYMNNKAAYLDELFSETQGTAFQGGG